MTKLRDLITQSCPTYTSVLCILATLKISVNELLFLSRAIWLTQYKADNDGYIYFSQDVVRKDLALTNSQIKYLKKNLLKREFISLHQNPNDDGSIPVRVEFENLINALEIDDTELNALLAPRDIARRFFQLSEVKVPFYPEFVRFGMKHSAALILSNLVYWHDNVFKAEGNFIQFDWVANNLCIGKGMARVAIKELQNLGLITSHRLRKRGKTHNIIDPDGFAILLLDSSEQNTRFDSLTVSVEEALNSKDKNENQGSKIDINKGKSDVTACQNPSTKGTNNKDQGKGKDPSETYSALELLIYLKSLPNKTLVKKLGVDEMQQIDLIYKILYNIDHQAKHTFKNWKKWLKSELLSTQS
jgi:hypothetical protein